MCKTEAHEADLASPIDGLPILCGKPSAIPISDYPKPRMPTCYSASNEGYLMGRTKKQPIYKAGQPKKKKSQYKPNISSGPVSQNLTTGANQLARRSPEPCRALSTDAPKKDGLTGDKLPPDFLGTAAYLLVADKMSLGPELLEAAGLGAISFQEHMQSKDGLERLAISQLLVTHGRVMWLSKLLTEQTKTKAIATLSASIDSALSTFARLIRALDEYRRPRGANTTVSIGQANVAGNQLVQNIQNQEVTPKYGNQTKSAPDQAAINTEIVPADTRGIALTPNGHQPKAPMDKKHGTKKPRRKGSGSDERA